MTFSTTINHFPGRLCHNSSGNYFRYVLFSLLTLFIAGYQPLNAQSSSLSDYLIITGDSGAVSIGPNNQLTGGNIGSYSQILSSGNLTYDGGFYSAGTILLSGGNAIDGDIHAANINADTGNIMESGTSSIFGGDVTANGDIFIAGGTVAGQIFHPAGFSYSGPAPAGGVVVGPVSFNSLPAMPPITTFPAAGNGKIANTQTISPGIYGSIALKGNRTVTFQGPGDYVFSSITNGGASNTFIFDFQNNATDVFRILVHGDVDLGKIEVIIINGGDASRIYTETHGDGASNSGIAWNISAGSTGGGNSSEWRGMVWAPYGSVQIGGGSDKAVIRGSIFSNYSVILNNNLNLEHVPFASCSIPKTITITPPDSLSCSDTSVTINATTNVVGGTINWTTTEGSITSGASTLSPTVGKPGWYYLEILDAFGCSTVDSVQVIFKSCIFPWINPDPSGKSFDLIGAELKALLADSAFADTAGFIFRLRGDSVFVEVIAVEGQFATLLALLQTAPYGMTNIIDNGPADLTIVGLMPILNLGKLDSIPQYVRFARPLFSPIFSSGLILSQGDAVVRGPFARGGFSLDGDSIKIGVLSDSYNTIPGNNAATDVSNEDLPGPANANNTNPVQVLQDYPFGIASDEGRAMLQIIHDVAPKATLAFRTGFLTAGDFAQGIYDLQAAGCDVIVDDIAYITEPFLIDGVVAQTVNNVVDSGVTYISSAGNFGSKSYTGTFNAAPAPAGITGMAHDYGGGDIFQNVSLTPGNYTIVMQWQDSVYSVGQTSTGAVVDLDFYLTEDDGTTLFGFNRDNIGGDPIEIMPFYVTQNTSTNFLVINASGSTAVPFKIMIYRGNLTFNEHISGTSTIVAHPNAEGAIAVGASFFGNTPAYGVTPPIVESFSSSGGTPVNGIVRNKPDIIAPDGVNTSVFLGAPNLDADPFPNFFGTSAAAPHAAGVAALIIQAQQKFESVDASPALVKSTMTSTAINMDAPGFDFLTGYGLLQADLAILSFANPTPALYSLQLQDTTLDPGIDSMVVILDGDFFTSGTSIMFRDDTLSSVFVNSHTMEATVPPFTGNPPIRACAESITSSGLDGGCSDTVLFFTPIKADVEVIMDSHTKLYTEAIPELTFQVLVDGVPYDSAGFTLADLGLDSLTTFTTATNFSGVGFYLIRANPVVLDPTDPFEAGLLELYNYQYTDGVLVIDPMPLIIAANDTTIVFGQKLGGFTFSYQYADSLVAAGDSILAYDSIFVNHASNITNAVAVVDEEAEGVYEASGRSLVNAEEVEELAYMASGRSLVNAGELRTDEAVYEASGRSLVNNHPDTSWVIFISAESIFEYKDSPDSTNVSQVNAFVNGKVLVDGESMISGRSIVNGTTISEETAATYEASGRSLVNTYPIVNGEPTSKDSSAVVLIFDEDDLDSTNVDSNLTFTPIVLITGYKVGTHYIVPPPLINRNYSIRYQLGTLTVLPDTIILEADSVSAVYGDSVAYNYSTAGYEYQDSDSTEIAGPPTYTLLDSALAPVTTNNIDAGLYVVVPDSLQLNDTTNYVVQYVNGWLYVSAANLDVSLADSTFATYGDTVELVVSYDGFKYDDSDTTTVIGGPDVSFLDSNGLPYTDSILVAGTYDANISNLQLANPANYSVNYVGGQLVIGLANLTATATDASKVYGDPNPPFNISYTGFRYDDDISDITPPTASSTATAASTVGGYPINLTGGTADNYSLQLVSGTLTIVPDTILVQARDTLIDEGDSLPPFSYDLIGGLNGTDVVTSPPSFSVNPVYNFLAGLYDIVPSGIGVTNSSSYVINYGNGTLYVNPAGNGVKNVKPSLKCVDTLVGHPSGFAYKAIFNWDNANAVAVYVPVGPDNHISGTGSWTGTLPTLFPPGSGEFEIYFDGSKITWELVSNLSTQKTSASQDASSTSNKCTGKGNGNGGAGNGNGNGNKSTARSADGSDATTTEVVLNLYPNPVKDQLLIHTDMNYVGEMIVTVYELNGQIVHNETFSLKNQDVSFLNLSYVNRGIYLVRVQTNDQTKFFRVTKE